MTKCKYKKVSTVYKHYGYDWSNLIVDNLILKNEHLWRITPPTDILFFQRINNKSLVGTYLMPWDYSKYDFSDVLAIDAYFGTESILPDDPEFFQKIRYKDVSGSVLPKDTLNKIHLYNLDKVHVNSPLP